MNKCFAYSDLVDLFSMCYQYWSFVFFFNSSICVYVCGEGQHLYNSVDDEVRGQLPGVDSLLPLCRFLGIEHSVHQAFEPSCQPSIKVPIKWAIWICEFKTGENKTKLNKDKTKTPTQRPIQARSKGFVCTS